MRVGIFEKVEAIANQPTSPAKGGVVTMMVVEDGGCLLSSSSTTVMDSMLVKANEVSEGLYFSLFLSFAASLYISCMLVKLISRM